MEKALIVTVITGHLSVYSRNILRVLFCPSDIASSRLSKNQNKLVVESLGIDLLCLNEGKSAVVIGRKPKLGNESLLLQ
jgi:hypothetical protein